MSWRRHSVTRFLSYRILEREKIKNVTTKFFAAKKFKLRNDFELL
jgi:hypothetical protein